MKVTPVEAGNRIQIPQEWAAEMGLTGLAALEKCGDGIMIHACTKTSWDEIYATKISPSSGQKEHGETGLSGDDLIF